MNVRQLYEMSVQGIDLVNFDPISAKEELFMYLEIIVANILLLIWFITRK